MGDELTRFDGVDLATLRDLVRWLADRGQIAASLTLASEWLVSYVMIVIGETRHHTGYAERQPCAAALAALEKGEEGTDSATADAISSILHQLDPQAVKSLTAVSSSIRHARNDLNHAGFNAGPSSASNLARQAKSIADQLLALAPL